MNKIKKGGYKNYLRKIASKVASEYEVILLASISFVAGLIFVFATPLGFGNDEMVHAYKAIALSKGQILSAKIGEPIKEGGTTYTVYGGLTPQSLSDLAALTAQARGAATCTSTACNKAPEKIEEAVSQTADRSINEPSNMVNFWGANSYIFIPYIPAAVGFSVAQIFDTSAGTALHLARIMNLIAGILLACFAFLLLRKTRFRWVVFAIALLPSTILSFGLLGVDGLLNGLSLVLLALITRRFTYKYPAREKKWLNYALVIVAVALPIIKIPYILLSLLILLPGVLSIKPSKRIFTYPLLAALIILPGIIWNISVSDTSKTSSMLVSSGTSTPDSAQQIDHIIKDPVSFTETLLKTASTYGTLPSVDNLTHQEGLKMPIDLTVLSLTPILIAILYACVNFRPSKQFKINAFFIIGSCFALVCGIFLAMYLTFNSVGSEMIEGVQGRYFIPVYGFLALALSILMNVTITPVSRLYKSLFILLAGLIPLLTAVWYVGIVH